MKVKTLLLSRGRAFQEERTVNENALAQSLQDDVKACFWAFWAVRDREEDACLGAEDTDGPQPRRGSGVTGYLMSAVVRFNSCEPVCNPKERDYKRRHLLSIYRAGTRTGARSLSHLILSTLGEAHRTNEEEAVQKGMRSPASSQAAEAEFSQRMFWLQSPRPPPLGLGQGYIRRPQCSVLPLLACPRFHLLFWFGSINSNFPPPHSGFLFHDPYLLCSTSFLSGS